MCCVDGSCAKKINIKRHGQLKIKQWRGQETVSKITEQPLRVMRSNIPMHLLFLNQDAPVSQANRNNMTFRASNLFPSHSCIGVP